MFGLTKPKLPISTEQQQWVDASMLRLGSLLGADRMLEATVVLPTPEHFPDPYDYSESSMKALFLRVAHAMQVDPAEIDLTLFTSEDEVTRQLVPNYSGRSSGAGGLYSHDPTAKSSISVHENKLKDPTALVAVLAHELGHIILLRPGLVQRDEPDMEPLNDLLTVFLGLGIFTANSAFRFEQFSNDRTQGWSTQRLGYLSEELFGFALARFAYERQEARPAWPSFLRPNIASYQKRSLAWLQDKKAPRLFAAQ
jgi:hypothetical protein